MHIQVIAVVPENYDGAWRAGRKWSSTEPKLVEVLDQEDDPPKVEVEHTNPEGVTTTRLIPDPDKIGRMTYNLLKEDGRIKILADNESVNAFSDRSLNAARRVAATASAENADLKVQVAALQEELAQLRAENEQLRKGASAGDDEAGDESTEGEEPAEGTEGTSRRRARRK